ncbi:hypothetical protein [Shewanella oncorhynchi]|uniref:hypothetical protein n=1 Tax=Shewanella oncorhynchi TaxID=2726434 RepID=UPI003D7BF354
MTEQETEIETQAVTYAKANRTRIARELTDLDKFPADQQPVSIFYVRLSWRWKNRSFKSVS